METAMPYSHLTLDERETIAQMRFAGHSPEEISRRLNRAPSTIRRELNRNGKSSGYTASAAHKAAIERRAQRPLQRKMDHDSLQTNARTMLSRNWSPDEIAGRLKREHPGDPKLHVSHQTIYRWLHAHPLLFEKFRSYMRHGRYRRRGSRPRGSIRNRVSIHDRETVIEERSRIGDWEGDTIVGKGHSGYVATFVDRKSGFLVTAKMNDKRATTLNRAAIRAFGPVPSSARFSITVDNGVEFAKHEQLAKRLGMPIYFADPYSSWQRGTNENTNGLLRQFIPKNMNILDLSRTALAFHTEQLNNRPRKRLHYQTPAEVFHQNSNSRT